MYQQCMEEALPSGDFDFIDVNCDINIPGFYYILLDYENYLPILPTKSEKLYFKQGKVSG